MDSIKIRRPFDAHRHLRQHVLLAITLLHLGVFRKALCMPNTKPPIVFPDDVRRYREEIKAALKDHVAFEPLVAVKLLKGATRQSIRAAYDAGAAAVKVYFRGTTTNAEDGILIEELPEFFAVFDEMQIINRTCKRRFPLLWHGEDPRAKNWEYQEARFMPTFELLVHMFPDLPMVVEHATTREAVRTVRRLGKMGCKVGCTITPHHLILTIDDVLRAKMRPDHFCLPTAKEIEDREALIEAATSGEPWFFLGTDDAVHPKEMKYCAECCGGIFIADYAINHYAEVFDRVGKLEALEGFASIFGPKFYGFEPEEETITLIRKMLFIPTTPFGSFTIFRQLEEVPWSVLTAA